VVAIGWIFEPRNFSPPNVPSVANRTLNMFLETGSVLRKKGSKRPTKRSAENIEEGEQRIIAEINPRK
jgi:hypothetical protein